MKFPLFSVHMPRHTIRRWITQPVVWALFFISPWLNVFRVDMIQKHLWFLGQAYPFKQQYVQWIPIAFYGVVLLIAITSVFLGRWFCGWACPHNAMSEWTRPIRALVGREALSSNLKRLQRFHPTRFRRLQWLSPVLSLFLTIGLSASLVCFVVSPQWFVQQWVSGKPHIALVFGQGLFTLIGLFLLYCGHDFCRTCCPYGMGQSVSAYVGKHWRPMEIWFTGQSQVIDCQTCTACQQICPVDIDPRQPENLRVGQFEGCFNCGSCIDACQYVHEFKHQSGLLSFRTPGLK